MQDDPRDELEGHWDRAEFKRDLDSVVTAGVTAVAVIVVVAMIVILVVW